MAGAGADRSAALRTPQNPSMYK